MFAINAAARAFQNRDCVALWITKTTRVLSSQGQRWSAAPLVTLQREKSGGSKRERLKFTQQRNYKLHVDRTPSQHRIIGCGNVGTEYKFLTDRTPAISSSLWKISFCGWHFWKKKTLEKAGKKQWWLPFVIDQFKQGLTTWLGFPLVRGHWLIQHGLLCFWEDSRMGVLQSKEVTRLEMEDAGNTRLDKDKIQLQATKILLQRQVYVDHAAVSTRKSRPFSVWHRWRSKDCIHGGSETVDLQYHVRSSPTGVAGCSSSFPNMTQVLPRPFSYFQLEDKLHLKGRGIDRFHMLAFQKKNKENEVEGNLGEKERMFKELICQRMAKTLREREALLKTS